MEGKILGFQFEPVSTKRTQPSYNNGSNQDEPETHHNRFSSQKWCNCQNCEKVPTRSECMCCHEILEVKAFHLTGKERLSWNTADLEFTEAVVHRCLKKVKACNFTKKRLQDRCFPANIVKFLRTVFFTDHLGGCF